MTSVLPNPDIESSIWIKQPPEVIWKYLSDVSIDTQWRDGMNSAKWISDPPHRVGSTGLHNVEGIGDWPWKVTVFEEPRKWAWEVTGGSFEGTHGAYHIEPEGDGSRFTMETLWKRSFFIKLMGFLLSGRIKRSNAADLERLKSILEA